jgi:hypothetical protein
LIIGIVNQSNVLLPTFSSNFDFSHNLGSIPQHNGGCNQ